MDEEPNADAKKFYDILEGAKHPIYDGCKEGLSQFSLAARFMSLKTDYNLPQNCMDSICEIMKEYLPEAKDIKWHAKRTMIDGEICHPSDGEAWKHFNEPLIEELKDLWFNGVNAYDISTKQNFLLRAVLMWTINDFLAYAMLSGWTTHGSLLFDDHFSQGTNFQSAGTSSASLQRPSVPQISNAQAAYIEANEQAANIEANEQREQVAPVIRDIRVLHPLRRNGAKWFKNNTEVSTRVRKIIEGCFQGPWYNWKRVPAYYKETWFSTFKTRYECDASIEHLVKANFDHLAATRLKGMVSLAKAKGKQPEWILSEHWRVMIDYWMTPKAKAKSEKARSSWLFSRDGLGAHCQRSGSSSYVKVQDALVANNEDSSFIAVMKKTHKKSDGTYVDERARLIAEKFDELVQERLSEMESPNGEVLTVDNLSQQEKNEIYLKLNL
ncbi:putative transposase Ptta/En/Spm plant [Arabidopsis thaliana x Arabidopsis arenosa]|uniref:Putative transposase Ptta/En/Spm plant n=1 Tax=Arabidopsis thaliana x Arabidopsis arenosa TaxID=1240361 RepID=A0A8T2EXV6_9BRAS|nr:putative transposase Ptta/En/Spm plant [Arabidopsis thaliana x Arabidopsis arenosa]